MGTIERVLARYFSKLAATQVGEEKFQRFNVKYLAQHAKFIPKIGQLLLDAEKQIEAAGYHIPHEIQVLITGRGAAHAAALYIPQVPPTIKIAPKSYERGDLIHTLIHELGHYFHDKVVPNGFGNVAIRAKYAWAVRQTSTGEGALSDTLNRKLTRIRAQREELQKQMNPTIRKGTSVEYSTMWYWNRQTYHVKGRILGKGREKRTVDVEVSSPPEFQALINAIFHRNNVYSEDISTIVKPDPEILAKMKVLGEEEMELAKQQAAVSEEKAPDTKYEALQHDWVPTTYARKDKMEWFAELFVTDVLGHLKPEVSEWLKTVVRTGTAA